MIVSGRKAPRGGAEVEVWTPRASQPTAADLGRGLADNYETTSPSTSLMTKLRCGSASASLCCARRASARVAYVPLRSSPSYTLYGARGLVLQRHALEVFAWMFDPILRLSISRQPERYDVHAIGLSVPTIRGTVLDDVADLELVGHLTVYGSSLRRLAP